jgi:hypothetical protein
MTDGFRSGAQCPECGRPYPWHRNGCQQVGSIDRKEPIVSENISREACIEYCRKAWTLGADAERNTVVLFIRKLAAEGEGEMSEFLYDLANLIDAGEPWNVREAKR